MKVVLFCGGLGLRLREHSENTPKPLAMLGDRPIIWHLMSYYAHYGHKDFILCLGYRGADFKDYFLNYNETVSNDFVLRAGGREVELMGQDISDWTIRFVDTGLHSNVGMRLKAVQQYLEGEEAFLANYSDGLSDLPLDGYVQTALDRGNIATFISVRPTAAFHFVDTEEDGTVNSIRSITDSSMRINGGFFVFRQKIFDYLREGEELVVEPFARLAAEKQLVAHRYDGFWQCMDTFKDKLALDELVERGEEPWRVR